MKLTKNVEVSYDLELECDTYDAGCSYPDGATVLKPKLSEKQFNSLMQSLEQEFVARAKGGMLQHDTYDQLELACEQVKCR